MLGFAIEPRLDKVNLTEVFFLVWQMRERVFSEAVQELQSRLLNRCFQKQPLLEAAIGLTSRNGWKSPSGGGDT